MMMMRGLRGHVCPSFPSDRFTGLVGKVYLTLHTSLIPETNAALSLVLCHAWPHSQQPAYPPHHCSLLPVQCYSPFWPLPDRLRTSCGKP